MLGLQAKADTLDIVTQSVSMVSILLAQYAQSTKYAFGTEGEDGNAVATFLFVSINLVLILVHLVLIAGPLKAKVQDAWSKYFAHRFGTKDEPEMELDQASLDKEKDLEIHTNPCKTPDEEAPQPAFPGPKAFPMAPTQGVTNLVLLHLF